MEFKKYVIPGTLILIALITVTISMIINKNDCDTLENRERRLREISNLGEIASIDQEVTIDGYMISGYTAKNNQQGLAVFVPTSNGKFKFQTNVNRQNDEVVFLAHPIHQTAYHIFWANKANLDYAQIIYTMDGVTGAPIKLDAQNNQIVYTAGPSNDVSVKYSFVDANGIRYE